MQSPSPLPSPLSASQFPSSAANQPLDHLTLPGSSSAGPFIISSALEGVEVGHTESGYLANHSVILEPDHPGTQPFLPITGFQSHYVPPVYSNGENRYGYTSGNTGFSEGNWYVNAEAQPDNAEMISNQTMPTYGDMYYPLMAPAEQPMISSNEIAPPAGFQFPMVQEPVAPKSRVPCQYCMKTFTRVPDRDRHIQSVHMGIKHHCSFPGCANNKGEGYARIDKIRKHQKETHGFTLV